MRGLGLAAGLVARAKVKIFSEYPGEVLWLGGAEGLVLGDEKS